MVLEKEVSKDLVLENIIANAVKIPLVKVNRTTFLSETFSDGDVPVEDVVELGPVAAGVPRERLLAMSKSLILKRTSQSSAASFVAGIPGGLAMAATVPADILQFFGMALRLAQELSYLYGAQDLWSDNAVDDERVKSQLIMYCGVMFGVSGAVSGVRVLSAQIAKTTLKKLPQKALTKTIWYPIVKQIAKAVGVKVTKTTVATGISKVIPIAGGVISGGLNFASMLPMANRLQTALDKANFDYTQEELEADVEEMETFAVQGVQEETEPDVKRMPEKFSKGIKSVGAGISSVFSKHKEMTSANTENGLETLEKLANLKDSGVLSQEEFEEKKVELLKKI